MIRGGTVSGDPFSVILFRPGGRLSVGHPERTPKGYSEVTEAVTEASRLHHHLGQRCSSRDSVWKIQK